MGPSGNWNLVFEDNFDGSAVDTTKWNATTSLFGNSMNGVTTIPGNAVVSGGVLTLTLSNSSTGAMLVTDPDYANPGFKFAEGVTEARCLFPDNGTANYNWSAWWTTAGWDLYPTSGENDIAENLGGWVTCTYNYHSPTLGDRADTIYGHFYQGWHVYTLQRIGSNCYWWVDGGLVASVNYANNNNYEHFLVLNIGNGEGNPVQTGAAGAMKVDYVRAWQ